MQETFNYAFWDLELALESIAILFCSLSLLILLMRLQNIFRVANRQDFMA